MRRRADVPPAGTRLLSGWSVGAELPTVTPGVLRRVAERADGRRAVLELAVYEGRAPLEAWLQQWGEEVEAWADADGFLRVLLAAGVPGTPWVARVIEAPRGQALDTLLGRPMLPARVVTLGLPIGRALASAHARSLAHGGLVPAHLHVRGDSVEIEPGGFEPLLDEARGQPAATRAADVDAFGALLCTLLAGRPARTLPPDVPAELNQLIARLTDPSPAARPPIDQALAALRELDGRYGDPSERATPSTATRTVAPRLGDVDVRLPPAPPPAPDLLSVVPAHDRIQTAPAERGEVPRAFLWLVVLLLVGLSIVLVGVWR